MEVVFTLNENQMSYIYIVQSKGAQFHCNTIIAPTGFCRKPDGTIEEDGTPSPEMGQVKFAYKFSSRQEAYRSAVALALPVIHELPGYHY